MYLRAIEIQGFKSFPQKTRLNFEKDITAIVGPNGSGKSNISDAMRWVMGEQSTKALRGGKMEDVIFGGTQKRSPLGFAEVSLILDNSGHIFDTDASEVMITRRYYRSGDSEYYINKKSCRLRDVNELLMDTGLGREGYSIIGQGRIDEILSVKSTDRREIFEEAAGISRFRHRKEESQRKLQQAEDNLLRINDKISELEMQVEPLRKQSETAKKYLVLRDRLRALEISVWTSDIEELDKRAEKLAGDFENISRQREDAQRRLQEFYDQSESVNEKIRQVDVKSEEIRGEIDENARRKSEFESSAAVLTATKNANDENIARIKSELENQEGRAAGIKGQIDELAEKISAASVYVSENGERELRIAAELDRLNAGSDSSQSELLELMRLENSVTASIAALEARGAALDENAESRSARLEELKNEIIKAEEKRNRAGEDFRQIKREIEEARDNLRSAENMVSGYKMRLEARSGKAKKAEDAVSGLRMDCRSMQSRIALLSEMEKDFAGYSKATKMVMQASDRGILRGICGTVGQLLKTKDEYSLAVETALGAAMQNIIVETDGDGKAGINYLRRNDGGRTTFQPVSTVKGGALKENLRGERGFCGLASELIEYDRKYSGIYLNLLGRTAVAETLDDAVNLGRKYQNRFRVVTLDGQVVNAGGSLTGGSNSKNAGILSRANELERLKKDLVSLEDKLKRAEADAAAAKAELEEVRRGIDRCVEEKRTYEDRLLKLETQRDHYEVLADAAEQALEDMEDQLAAAERDGKAFGIERANILREISESGAKLESIRARSREKALENEEFARRISDIRQAREEAARERAAQEAEIAAASSAKANLERLLEDMAGGSDSQRSLIARLLNENEIIENDIIKRLESAENCGKNEEKLRDELKSAAGYKLELERERATRDRGLQDLNSQILNLERESGRLEQLKISAEMSAKQIIDKLWDNYELTRSQAREQSSELADKGETQRQISELRRDISKLGTPNIGAIEEFERVNSRYTYLTGQRDDVQKSKSELDEIIGDITKEMTEIFAVKFKEIDDSFRGTFTELFGGGRASLELEDKNDILNCGIEIKVQPPGKSLKTLTLLSGGEKAFVAIALYFAILKIRPTPFVIMDEIESALDEVNNARFAEYMRRLTDKTQFLVITHRRRTMEEADVLYGVTMQEKGVSQIINIDLDEAEKTILK